MATKISSMLGNPAEKDALADIQRDLAALRTVVAALVVDTGVLDTALDTFATKLNADATAQNAAVTNSQLDTDYAGAASAMTATAPAALNTSI